jgi:hypothetical protein
MKFKTLFCFVITACFLAAFTPPAYPQSTTAGDVVVVVADPSGAVVPNAKATAKSDATNAIQTTTTNGEGSARFALLQPGTYTITVEATGFKSASAKVQVTIGQVATANIKLSVGGDVVTVEVTTPTLQVESADVSTPFSIEQIAQLPNPGNDLSAIAQTAPGVVMNNGGGFGNFSSFGLPATSNLFTLNGMNDNDPFLNLNNSGATNLLLGANDLAEATVTNNGYSGQYGQLAGAQINYVTKSGTNLWHGNAAYQWNGRALNANDYFNNATKTPRPFDNVNQWALSLGGPIKKDKTFFFFNYEGLRVVLPTTNPTLIPSTQLQNAILANLTGGAQQTAFYKSIFSQYNGAKGASAAVLASNCGDAGVTLPGLNATDPCTNTFQSTAGNFTHEYLMNVRVDHNITEKDRLYVRWQTDQGTQATFTDAVNPVFNALSIQPEYQGQIGWTHEFKNAVNEFKLSEAWYSAIFKNPSTSAALAAFPTTMIFLDGSLQTLGGIDLVFPQGRNVEQYQFVDDYQMTRGKHTWKFGVNYHRDDVTDFSPTINSSGRLFEFSLADFASGNADFYQQSYATRISQPIALYTVGIYAQDEWRIRNNLKVSLALRVDHNSNPVCQTNCFANLAQPFTTLLSNPAASTIPYNKLIKTGLHQAYPSTDILVWQPRLGFTWSPFHSSKTVVSGGIGIFTDSFPATVVDSFLNNSPFTNTFAVGALFGPGATLSSPSDPNSNFAAANQANHDFLSNFASGLAPTGAFAPNMTGSDKEIRQPRYTEWNLQVQRELPWKTVFSMNYVGNHGIYEVVANSGLNAFAPGGITGLPTSAPVSSLGQVTQLQSIATSNYNGLVTSLRHSFNRGLQFQVNYTWSHALDDISNAGLLPYNQNTAPSIGTLTNPFKLRANYGNADYDIRHNFTANYVWDNSLRHLFKWGPNVLFSGWNFSGTIFSHSGTPFSVIDSASTAGVVNYTGPLLANVIGNPLGSVSCGVKSTNIGPDTSQPPQCLNPAGFNDQTGSLTAFSNQERNSFRGPGYFDTDFAVMKHTKLPRVERGELVFGFQFFNLFNHPNFDNPINDVGTSSNSPTNPHNKFGVVTRTVNTPTSILGSFLGGDASPRLIQLKAEFKF